MKTVQISLTVDQARFLANVLAGVADRAWFEYADHPEAFTVSALEVQRDHNLLYHISAMVNRSIDGAV